MLNRKDNSSRRDILSAYQELRVKHPHGKKFSFIKRVAFTMGYVLDKKNGSSSYVMKVIRESEL